MKKEKFPIAIIIATLSILANIALGIMFFAKSSAPAASQPGSTTHDPSLGDQSGYPFLSKRIFAENQNDLILNFVPLRTALREYVNKLPDQVGVYFEYLPSGTSIGVNDKLEVRLASLIKTPLIMGVYRQIEKGQTGKETVLTLKKDDLDQKFGDLWKRGAGAKLTVKEAVDLALIKSDNTAANVLLSVVPANAIDDVFDSLDIETSSDGEINLVTPKGYSSIFRSLYLSSYLKRDSSNEILEILTRTDFDDQIASEIPKNIKVSHKFGIYNSENAHSDCGIVYAPGRPYLLCIMTKSSQEKAREYMGHISKMIYGYVTIAK